MTDICCTEQEIDRKIGRRINRRRIQLAVTEDQLADSIGVSRDTICAYEQGSIGVSASRLARIADRLCVQITYFYSDALQNEETKTFLEISHLPAAWQIQLNVLVQSFKNP